MAAGLSLETEKIEAFRNAFNEHARQVLSEDDLKPTLEIDAEVSLSELTLKTVEWIERLGPFGAGNPKVTLVARDLRLVAPPRKMGAKGDHLQLTVAPHADQQAHMTPGGVIRAVAFKKARWEKKLLDDESFDLAFQPVINHFNGNTTVEMLVKDLLL